MTIPFILENEEPKILVWKKLKFQLLPCKTVMQNSVMKLLFIFKRPIPKVLPVNISQQTNVSFVTHNQNNIVSHVF